MNGRRDAKGEGFAWVIMALPGVTDGANFCLLPGGCSGYR